MDEEQDIMRDGIPAIIEAARGGREAEVIQVIGGVEDTEPLALEGTSISAVPMVAVPTAGGGVQLVSVKAEVDAWRKEHATRPQRRQGTARFEELESFVEHVKRFKDPDSAIFVSGGAAAPSFLSVLDYHPAGAEGEVEPRFGTHRGSYAPRFSDEWSAWAAAASKHLSQADFAAVITTNVRDVLDADGLPDGRLAEAPAWFAKRFGGGRAGGEFYASAERMLELAEGLTVTVQDRVGDVARRDSGETKISFESERTTDVEIPIAFLLEIPVFLGGELWQIPVRLRFTLRTEGDTKRAQWRIELFGAARTVLACVAEMRKKIEKDTGLPLFAGVPE